MDRIDSNQEPSRDPKAARDSSESNTVDYGATGSRDLDRRVKADLAGESIGGMGGTIGGAAIGSLGGPMGAVLGAIAGAIGGWWAGREAAESAVNTRESDERAYRMHYALAAARPDELGYADVRTAYVIGALAGRNPDYHDRSFEQIEPELERGWNAVRNEHAGQWPQLRAYARYAFWRARGEGVGQ